MISCYFCHQSNPEKNVEFHLISKTTKRSMCDECYTKYKEVAFIPLITEDEIKQIEQEEKEIREKRIGK